MTDLQIGFALVAAMVVVVMLGMEIGLSLAALSFVGVWLIRDNWAIAERMLALSAYSGIQDYAFATIPLFVLMGIFVSVSDIGKDTFEVFEWGMRRIAGGLGMATVAANTVFASVTGISIASAAVFTRVAVPEMLRHGYSARFAVGIVAGSSILGMLIPPSLLLIIYGVLSEQSIGKLFIAGVVPGLVMALGFCVAIFVLAVFFPGFSVSRGQASRKTLGEGEVRDETLASISKKLLPIALLVLMILGGLYSGFFTPTEAGGVGAFGAFLLALARRRLSIRKLWQILIETGVISVGVLFLLIAANMYSRMLAMSGVPEALAASLGGLGHVGFMLLYLGVLILLGMILDSSSILLIVVPIALPLAQGFGQDLIHFGVVTVIAVEIGLLTPPLGLSAFSVKASLADQSVRLGTIFAGAAPFVVVMLIVLALLIVFPELVTAFLTGT